MTRLDVFTPLPPSGSGIARYSAELLPALAADYAITAVIADDAPSPAPLPDSIRVARAGAARATLPRPHATIYQLGNSPEHAYIAAHAEQEPGICILHDVALPHLQLWRALHGGADATRAYSAEMALRYGTIGQRAAADLLHNRQSPVPYADIPLCERIVERSLLTVVHSAYARAAVLRHCPGVAVQIVPHGVPLLPEGDRAQARATLGLPQGAVIVAALGNLIPEKRLERALGAFARALYHLPEAVFVVAGASTPHYDPRPLARHAGLEPVTRWLGRVGDETFQQLLVAADLCVNLRWPTGGETSGSLLRMLAAGRLTLVSDAGSFVEVPEDACVKVPLGDDEEATIVRAIICAGREPAWAATLGARARAFIAREHSFARAASGYRDAIARATPPASNR